MNTGSLFIVSAPSGAGKTTLVQQLAAEDPSIRISVSWTTRPPRPGEIEGVHYHFVDAATFSALAARGEFLESAQVHGYHYATSRTWIEAQLREGQDIVLEIDWQGARQIRALFAHAVGIFILPPSPETLALRLRTRASDDAATIARRLAAATEEMAHVNEFDFVIINSTIAEALCDLRAAVRAARLRLAVQRLRYPALFAHLEHA